MKDLIEIFAVNEEGHRELVKSQAIEYLWKEDGGDIKSVKPVDLI